MIDIGYLTDPRYDISAICNLEEVEPTRVEQIDAQFIKFCPAVKTLYANTFEIARIVLPLPKDCLIYGLKSCFGELFFSDF